MGGNVEQWRGLVAQHFSDVDKALCVIRYESGGNPYARSYKDARGLFQLMFWWADHFGISRDSLYDPATNVRYAAKVLGAQGWRAWNVVKSGKC